MKTEMGEYVVRAYLKEVLRCDFVDYNVRPPGGGLERIVQEVLGVVHATIHEEFLRKGLSAQQALAAVGTRCDREAPRLKCGR
jgi:hypothetical protein